MPDSKLRAAALAAAIACAAGVTAGAHAQSISPESVSPFKRVTVSNVDAQGVPMPDLAYSATPEDAKDFDKYYFFARADTDFATAFADVAECDGYASGLSSGMNVASVPYPYAGTMAGVVGGAIGNAMAQAIFGSAEKRRLRRLNMRRCMHFKGYGRYGLSKDLWQKFNFEEGLSGVDPEARLKLLKQQALVATQAQPKQKALGL